MTDGLLVGTCDRGPVPGDVPDGERCDCEGDGDADGGSGDDHRAESPASERDGSLADRGDPVEVAQAEAVESFRADGGEPLSALQRDVLVALGAMDRADDLPASGQDIGNVRARVTGRDISGRALYECLDRLTDAGLVDKRPYGISGRTNAYALTTAGRRCLRERAAVLSLAVDVRVDAGDDADPDGR